MYQNGIALLSQKLQKTSTCFWFGSRGRNHVDSRSICFNVTTTVNEKRKKKNTSFSVLLFTLLCTKTKTTHKVPLICQVISRYHFFWCLVPEKLFTIQNHGTVEGHQIISIFFFNLCQHPCFAFFFQRFVSFFFFRKMSPFICFFFHGLYSASAQFELPTF